MWWVGVLLLILPATLQASVVYTNASMDSNSTQGCGGSWQEACPTLQASVTMACQNFTQLDNDTTILVAPGEYVLGDTLIIPCPVHLRSLQGSSETFIVFQSTTEEGIHWQGSDNGSWNASMRGFTLGGGMGNTSVSILVSKAYDQLWLEDFVWHYSTQGSLLRVSSESTQNLTLVNWTLENLLFAENGVRIEGVDHVHVEGWHWHSIFLSIDNVNQNDSLLYIDANQSLTLQNVTWNSCTGSDGAHVGVLSAPQISLSQVAMSDLFLFSYGITLNVKEESTEIAIDDFTCVHSSFQGNVLLVDASAQEFVTVPIVQFRDLAFESNVCPTLIGVKRVNTTAERLVMKRNVCSYGLRVAHSSLFINNCTLEGQVMRIAVLYLLNSTFSINGTQAKNNHISHDGGVFGVFDSQGTISMGEFSFNQGRPILKSGGELNITESAFTTNFASGGGVVYHNGGTLNIFRVNCTANRVDGQGGAILHFKGVLHVVESIFFGNSAEEGGAFCQMEGLLFISASIFSRNSGESMGGAIFQRSGLMNISTSSLLNNIAPQGGAFFQADWLYSGVVVIEESEFQSNTASDQGAALYQAGTSVTIRTSIFQNNHGDLQTGSLGGVIFLHGGVLEISGSTFTGNSGALGGVLYVQGDQAQVSDQDSTPAQNTNWIASQATTPRNTVVIEDSILDGNTADSGGAIYALDLVTLSIKNSYVKNNRANNGGGGGIITGVTAASVRDVLQRVDIFNTTFEKNYARSSGASLCLTGNVLCNLTSSNCNNNTADSGGCAFIDGWVRVNSSHNTFMYNFGTNSGGGVYIEGDDATVMDEFSYFGNNKAAQGAGLGFNGGSSVQISESLFVFNQAFKTGGAISLGGSSTYSFALYKTNFTNNSANIGGAVSIQSLASNNLQITNCTWSKNMALEYGGAIYLDSYTTDAFPFVSDGEFNDNDAKYGGCNLACTPASYINNVLTFCGNCTFGEPIQGYNGFQLYPSQVATAPSTLRVSDLGNHSVYIDQPEANLTVSLQDAFGSEVQGNYLYDHPYLVSASLPYGVSSESDPSWNLNTTSSIVYPTFELCGRNQQVFEIAFNATPTLDGPLFYTHVDVKLEGCSKNNHSPRPGDPCSTCRLELQILILILALVVFVLVVSLSVGFACFIAARRYARRYKLRNMQVPDLTKGDYSLEDILEDNAIAQLNWTDVEFGQVLGKGASGLVRKAIWKRGGSERLIATKELLLIEENADDSDIVQEFCKEIKYMSSLHHPNVVGVIGIIVSPDGANIYLASELMERGSLHDIIVKKGDNLPLSLRFRIAIDAAEGMKFIHSKRVIHRDLKSHNLLINAEWQTKVADFGVSTVNPTITRQMTCIGTPIYMAPEVLQKESYSARADVYSFGVVLCELFTSRQPYSDPPFDTMNMPILTHHILEKNARPTIEDLHPTLQNLIEECWSADPYARPTFDEIINRLKRLNRDVMPSRVGESIDLESQDNLERHLSAESIQ